MDVFTKIDLKNTGICEIFEVKPKHIWLARVQHALSDKKYDMTPYLYVNVIKINGKSISVEALGDMDFFDYQEINAVIERMITPL